MTRSCSRHPGFRSSRRVSKGAPVHITPLQTKDYVSVVAVTEDGRLLLVRQFRPAVGRMTLELPSGHVEPGETPEQAARKELLEETGYLADTFTLLGNLSPDTGRLGNRMWCFFAKGARRESQTAFRSRARNRACLVRAVAAPTCSPSRNSTALELRRALALRRQRRPFGTKGLTRDMRDPISVGIVGIGYGQHVLAPAFAADDAVPARGDLRRIRPTAPRPSRRRLGIPAHWVTGERLVADPEIDVARDRRTSRAPGPAGDGGGRGGESRLLRKARGTDCQPGPRDASVRSRTPASFTPSTSSSPRSPPGNGLRRSFMVESSARSPV